MQYKCKTYSKHHSLLRFVAIGILLSFGIQQIATAAPLSSSTGNLSFAPAPLFHIPTEIGHVDDTYSAPLNNSQVAPKTIVLIQDAHANASGQENLAKALDLILEQTGAEYVFTEAAWGNQSLTHIKKIADPRKIQQISMNYLKKGLIKGSEYLNVTNRKDFILWGVENRDLYDQSLSVYKSILENQKAYQAYLTQMERTLHSVSLHYLSGEAKEYMKLHSKYLDEKINVSDYAEGLNNLALVTGVNLNSVEQIQLLIGLKQLERTIDYRQASEGQALLIQSSQDSTKQRVIESFKILQTNELVSTNDSGIATSAMHFLIAEIAENKNSNKLEALKSYLSYLERSKAMDIKRILIEIEQTEKLMVLKLAQSEDERLLFQFQKSLRFLKKYAELRVTPDEYDVYEQTKSFHEASQISGFLNKKIIELNKYYEQAIPLNPSIEKLLRLSDEFYQLTLERDQVFLKEMERVMGAHSQSIAILVTGGYHAANIKKLLRNQNISYVTVVPQVLHETDYKLYESLLFSQSQSKELSREVSQSSIRKMEANYPKDALMHLLMRDMRLNTSQTVFEAWVQDLEIDMVDVRFAEPEIRLKRDNSGKASTGRPTLSMAASRLANEQSVAFFEANVLAKTDLAESRDSHHFYSWDLRKEVPDIMRNELVVQEDHYQEIRQILEQKAAMLRDGNDSQKATAEILGPALRARVKVFDGIISKVAFMTSKEDRENDYLLVYFDKEKNTLYVAKEIFSEFPTPNLAAEHIYQVIAGESVSDNERKTLFSENNGVGVSGIDFYIKRFLILRTMHYGVKGLPRIIAEMYEEGGTIAREQGSDAATVFSKNVWDQKIFPFVRRVTSISDRVIRDTIVKDMKQATQKGKLVEVQGVLGKHGYWSAFLHDLYREMRHAIDEGDLKQLAYLHSLAAPVTVHILPQAEPQYGIDRDSSWLSEEFHQLKTEFDTFILEVGDFLTEELAELKKLSGSFTKIDKAVTSYQRIMDLYELFLESPSIDGAKIITDSVDESIALIRTQHPQWTDQLLEGYEAKQHKYVPEEKVVESEVSGIGARLTNTGANLDLSRVLPKNVKKLIGEEVERLFINLLEQRYAEEYREVPAEDEIVSLFEQAGLAPNKLNGISRAQRSQIVRNITDAVESIKPQAVPGTPIEQSGESIITSDLALGLLGDILGIKFNVPASAVQKGYWEYELKLSEQERQIFNREILPAFNRQGKPTKIYIVFKGDKPVDLVTAGLNFSQLREATQENMETAFRQSIQKTYSKSTLRAGTIAKRIDQEIQKILKQSNFAVGINASPHIQTNDGDIFETAGSWFETHHLEFVGVHSDGSNHGAIIDTHQPAQTSQPIISFFIQGVYAPSHLSSHVFTSGISGISPDRREHIFELGYGTAVNLQVAAELAQGNIDLVGSEISERADQVARWNLKQFPYAEQIDLRLVALGTIFPANETFDRIWANLPLEGEDAEDAQTVDVGGKLFLSILSQAAGSLNEEGLLEFTYAVTPKAISQIYEYGWEPVALTGIKDARNILKNNTFDYARFILVRAVEGVVPETFQTDLRALASIDELALSELRSPNPSEKKQIREIIERYPRTDGFRAQLIRSLGRALLDTGIFEKTRELTENTLVHNDSNYTNVLNRLGFGARLTHDRSTFPSQDGLDISLLGVGSDNKRALDYLTEVNEQSSNPINLTGARLSQSKAASRKKVDFKTQAVRDFIPHLYGFFEERFENQDTTAQINELVPHLQSLIQKLGISIPDSRTTFHQLLANGGEVSWDDFIALTQVLHYDIFIPNDFYIRVGHASDNGGHYKYQFIYAEVLRSSTAVVQNDYLKNRISIPIRRVKIKDPKNPAVNLEIPASAFHMRGEVVINDAQMQKAVRDVTQEIKLAQSLVSRIYQQKKNLESRFPGKKVTNNPAENLRNFAAEFIDDDRPWIPFLYAMFYEDDILSASSVDSALEIILIRHEVQHAVLELLEDQSEESDLDGDHSTLDKYYDPVQPLNPDDESNLQYLDALASILFGKTQGTLRKLFDDATNQSQKVHYFETANEVRSYLEEFISAEHTGFVAHKNLPKGFTEISSDPHIRASSFITEQFILKYESEIQKLLDGDDLIQRYYRKTIVLQHIMKNPLDARRWATEIRDAEFNLETVASLSITNEKLVRLKKSPVNGARLTQKDSEDITKSMFAGIFAGVVSTNAPIIEDASPSELSEHETKALEVFAIHVLQDRDYAIRWNDERTSIISVHRDKQDVVVLIAGEVILRVDYQVASQTYQNALTAMESSSLLEAGASAFTIAEAINDSSGFYQQTIQDMTSSDRKITLHYQVPVDQIFDRNQLGDDDINLQLRLLIGSIKVANQWGHELHFYFSKESVSKMSESTQRLLENIQLKNPFIHLSDPPTASTIIQWYVGKHQDATRINVRLSQTTKKALQNWFDAIAIPLIAVLDTVDDATEGQEIKARFDATQQFSLTTYLLLRSKFVGNTASQRELLEAFKGRRVFSTPLKQLAVNVNRWISDTRMAINYLRTSA